MSTDAAQRDTPDPAELRIETMLDHTVRTALVGLVLAGVLRAWQAGEHSVAAAVVGAVMVLLAAVRGVRSRAALVLLVALWAVGSWLSPAFAWVAFPLFFLVIHAFSHGGRGTRVLGGVALAALTAWSAWTSGSVMGPVVGALAAVLGALVFGEQRADASRHRALVAELREAQATIATAERERGVLAERERLAREIHDTIAQGLASIVMLARTGGDDVLPLIESTARDNLAEARRVVRALGSPGEIGLVDGLRSLVEDTRARAAAEGRPLDVELSVDGPEPAPAPDVVQALHRGAQASLANVLRHAGARRCVVGVSTFPGRVVVDIADDGIGFRESEVGPDSFGLRGLRARMAEVGGSVSVDSEAGVGTTIGLSAPLPPKETR